MDIAMQRRLQNATKQTFCGVVMQQSWTDLWLWEQLLNASYRIQSIIEIGTKYGGLSLYLRAQVMFRGMFFFTCDIGPCPQHVLKSNFIEGNVFRNNGEDFREVLAGAPRPLILFCDGGDKRTEVRMFVPFLQPGDIVGVHDWNSEIGAEDMLCVEQYLELLMLDECEAMGSMTRFWTRK